MTSLRRCASCLEIEQRYAKLMRCCHGNIQCIGQFIADQMGDECRAFADFDAATSFCNGLLCAYILLNQATWQAGQGPFFLRLPPFS